MNRAIGRRSLIVATASAAVLATVALQAAAGTAPSWHIAAVIGSKRASNLFSIASAGPHNAWTFGTGPRAKPLVLHWNGTAWSTETLTGARYPATQASASSPDNVWAAGFQCEGGLGSPPLSGEISRWNGHRWATAVYSPLKWCPSGPLVTMSPTDGWWFPGANVAMHFHGSKWQAVSLGKAGAVLAASAVSASDVWAFTTGASHQVRAIRWNGHAWRTVPFPTFKLKRGESVYPWASYASASTGVWVSVSHVPAPQYSNPVLLHRVGNGWRHVTAPGGAIVVEMTADGNGGFWCIGWSPSSNTQYAFLHYDRGSWTSYPVPIAGLPGNPAEVDFSVYGIANIPGTRSVWATGDSQFFNSQDVLQDYSVIYKFRT